jgi:hypothetical protein
MADKLSCAKPDMILGLADQTEKVTQLRPRRAGEFGVAHNAYKFDPFLYELCGLTQEDISSLKCGLARPFTFPLFVLERKSDSGSGFVARNQLFTGLLSLYESQTTANAKISANLPVLALGMTNLGDLFELYCMTNLKVCLSPYDFLIIQGRCRWDERTGDCQN